MDGGVVWLQELRLLRKKIAASRGEHCADVLVHLTDSVKQWLRAMDDSRFLAPSDLQNGDRQAQADRNEKREHEKRSPERPADRRVHSYKPSRDPCKSDAARNGEPKLSTLAGS